METIKTWWRAGFLCFLFLSAIFAWYAVYLEDRQGILTVSFLDVGQGDAIFIDAPNGNQMLIDGGPLGRGVRALSRAMPFYDRSIDMIALSHPHLDHFGGLIDILGRYEVGAIVTSGTKNDTPEYRAFEDAEKNAGLREFVAERGMRIDMGRGVFLDILLPDGDVSGATPHDGMLVMRLSYGKRSIVLTGDMEQNLEAYLSGIEGTELKSDVLKAGHHGSHTSTSENFLGFVSPEYAVISLGKGNSYGHPHKETLATLEKFGAKILRTDEVGTITLKTDGEMLAIQ